MDQHDISVLVRASTPLIVVESHEEDQIVEMFRNVITEVWRPLYKWTITDGLKRLDLDGPTEDNTTDPANALRKIRDDRERGIYLLVDFSPYLRDPVHLRLMREIIQGYEGRKPDTLVLIGPKYEMPPALKPEAHFLTPRLPDAQALERVVREEAFHWSRAHAGRRVKVSKPAMDILIRNLGGLTLNDARRLARNAIFNDGAIRQDDVREVMQAKFELLNRGGVLSFEYDTVSMDQIGGMANLKQWLSIRKTIFHQQQGPAGLAPPRGILLLGVQGCGKSMAAKAAASAFGVPLLRLDIGAMYNKYHGQTEENLRQSLKTAELMAPCVLWMDEIEKGIATSSSDDGVSRRVLGTFLTWMAERKAPVFMVATANDIASLPPELMRKGRFDELFFVDLPDLATREHILSLQLQSREISTDQIDIATLASQSDGWSGAELEQAIVQAMYTAFAQSRDITQADLEIAIQQSVPLSMTMREQVASLRQWAQGRTVLA